MINETIDLYGFFGQNRNAAAGGMLTCLALRTPADISPRRRRPAILILPGGGYHHTSSREAENVAMRFVSAGYAAFVLRYSCAPSVFPTALREAAMAMRYIRQQADAYEIHPRMVAAMGFSAGGHLCGTLGTMFDCPEIADLGPGAMLRPDALALCYPVAVSWGRTHEGSFDNLTGGAPALRERLSLDRLVRPDMPPAFLWHTRDDGSVSCRNSLLLAAAMEEAGVDFALHIYHHGPHGLSTADATAFPTWGVPDVSSGVMGWIGEVLNFFSETGLRITDMEETG